MEGRREALKIVFENGLYCPMVFCDQCGERIVKSGNYEYRVGKEGQPETGEIFFTHKECCRAFEETHGGKTGWHANELDELPLFLRNNLKITKEDEEKMLERLRLKQGI